VNQAISATEKHCTNSPASSSRCCVSVCCINAHLSHSTIIRGRCQWLFDDDNDVVLWLIRCRYRQLCGTCWWKTSDRDATAILTTYVTYRVQSQNSLLIQRLRWHKVVSAATKRSFHVSLCALILNLVILQCLRRLSLTTATKLLVQSMIVFCLVSPAPWRYCTFHPPSTLSHTLFASV